MQLCKRASMGNQSSDCADSYCKPLFLALRGDAVRMVRTEL